METMQAKDTKRFGRRSAQKLTGRRGSVGKVDIAAKNGTTIRHMKNEGRGTLKSAGGRGERVVRGSRVSLRG